MSLGNIAISDVDYMKKVRYWTGSDTSGALDSNNCSNFTSDGGNGSFGDATTLNADFLKGGIYQCNSNLGLLCICF